MSQRNETVDLILDELERYGLRGEVSDRSKHIEIAWETSIGRRFTIVAKTASDWRSALNARSDVRKMLRADNMQIKPINNLTYHRAMSLPKEPTFSHEQILHKDVEALTDLVFELQVQLSEMREQNTAILDKLNSVRVIARVEFGVQDSGNIVVGGPVEQLRKILHGSVRQTKTDMVLNLLSEQWRHVSDVIKESGLTRAHVNNILMKAKKRGQAENGLRGQWRRI